MPISMAAKQSNTRRVLQSVGHELKANPPRIIEHTARKFGRNRADKQRVAILLSKARRQGARLNKKG